MHIGYWDSLSKALVPNSHLGWDDAVGWHYTQSPWPSQAVLPSSTENNSVRSMSEELIRKCGRPQGFSLKPCDLLPSELSPWPEPKCLVTICSHKGQLLFSGLSSSATSTTASQLHLHVPIAKTTGRMEDISPAFTTKIIRFVPSASPHKSLSSEFVWLLHLVLLIAEFSGPKLR